MYFRNYLSTKRDSIMYKLNIINLKTKINDLSKKSLINKFHIFLFKIL